MNNNFNIKLYFSKMILSLLGCISFLIFTFLSEEMKTSKQLYFNPQFITISLVCLLAYLLYSIANGVVYIYFRRNKLVRMINIFDTLLFLLSIGIASGITYRSFIDDFVFFNYSVFIVITLNLFTGLLFNNIQSFKEVIDLNRMPFLLYPLLKMILIFVVTLFPLINLESPKIFQMILVAYIGINLTYYIIPWKKKTIIEKTLCFVNIVDIILIICCIICGFTWLFLGITSPYFDHAILVFFLYPTVISVIFLSALSLILNNRPNIPWRKIVSLGTEVHQTKR